jgi:phenylpropionate dioxygenase-like ring-hydroxylating dioxygenase large terminal subunit
MNLERIISSYDPSAQLAQASTIPASWYLDPELAELERQTVFSRSWQVVARLDQVQKPGQYITCDVASEPLVVVRGNDHVLRGFFNVCRHHAAAVMTESSGEADHMECPYHGWTYALNGDLKSAPDLGSVINFDRKSMGLVPVEVAVWKHWVIARLDRDGAQITSLSNVDITRYHWFERRHYFLDCNWKVFVDNYLDGGYHVPHLHKALNRVLDYSEYQIELGDRFCLQWSPFSASARALYYWIYPNFMINIYPDAMDTNLVLPRGLSRTEVVFDFYFTDVSDTARERNLVSIAGSEEIQNEDVAICRSVQRGLASRAYNSGRLSARREAGEHLFHRLLHADLISAFTAPAVSPASK